MVRKPKSSIGVHLEADRKRQAHQVQLFDRMNEAAFRSIVHNETVLRTGVTLNVIKGAILPAAIVAAENQRRRRDRK